MAFPASPNGPWTISCAREDGASPHSALTYSASSGSTRTITRGSARLAPRMDGLAWTKCPTFLDKVSIRFLANEVRVQDNLLNSSLDNGSICLLVQLFARPIQADTA